jgi:uncharacterized membrane protein
MQAFRSASALYARHADKFLLGIVLAMSSAAAVAMLAFRFYYSGTAGYAGMAWNLFLAWVPLALAVPVYRFRAGGRGTWGPLVLFGAAWLLFFPNAPYLLTEFIHLDPAYRVTQRPLHVLAGVSPGRFVPVWYDVVLLLTFAWNGLLLGFVSLHLVQRAVRERLGPAWGWVTVVIVLVLSGFGISLGRFQRWNSWDVLSEPTALLADVAHRVLVPHAHPRTAAVTILFAGFLLIAYLSILSLAALQRELRPPPP